MNADIILYNGKIHTGDSQQAAVNAVAIFVAVGSEQDVLSAKGSQTKMIVSIAKP